MKGIREKSVSERLRQNKRKTKKNKKRARIVIKNLPFSTSEDNLKEHFEKYGEIKEITILKNPDGYVSGCAFIQYELVQKAAKAIHYCNGRNFLGRDLIVEWAQPKCKYKQLQQKVKVKEEPIDNYDSNLQVKTEFHEELLPVKKQEEIKIGNEVNVNDLRDDSCNNYFNVNETINANDVIYFSSDEIDEESVTDKEDSGKDLKSEENGENYKNNILSNDVIEKKTLFIKNVPFQTTNEDLMQFFSRFGSLFYALICIDPLTEHSKGTAFVKFKYKEDAEKCLDSKDLILFGNILECSPALSKKELEQKIKEKHDQKTKKNDSRNLYLVKEGVILAGSKAAEGVSENDMTKRLQLEQYKTQMLRNLNRYISKYRIVVHNLPLNWNDKKLRDLCAMYADSKAQITEARIMRDMKQVDVHNRGKSKGFGFVTFSTHEDALHVLRSLNNNPHVFSINKRPIVTFSIENKSKVLAKEKRMLNSKMKNPLFKANQNNSVKKREQTVGKGKKLNSSKIKNISNECMTESFSGVTSNPGDFGFKKLRSNFHLKNQAKIHHENVKKLNKIKKSSKKSLAERSEQFTKQPKQKINQNKIQLNDIFSKMVNEYKKKILSGQNYNIVKKDKWYNFSD